MGPQHTTQFVMNGNSVTPPCVVGPADCGGGAVFITSSSGDKHLGDGAISPPVPPQVFWDQLQQQPQPILNGGGGELQQGQGYNWQQEYNNYPQNSAPLEVPTLSAQESFCDYGQFPHYSPQSVEMQQQQQQPYDPSIEAMASHAVTELNALASYDVNGDAAEATYAEMCNVEANNPGDILSQSMRVAFGDGFNSQAPPQGYVDQQQQQQQLQSWTNQQHSYPTDMQSYAEERVTQQRCV
jgi:hypothetical protein